MVIEIRNRTDIFCSSELVRLVTFFFQIMNFTSFKVHLENVWTSVIKSNQKKISYNHSQFKKPSPTSVNHSWILFSQDIKKYQAMLYYVLLLLYSRIFFSMLATTNIVTMCLKIVTALFGKLYKRIVVVTLFWTLNMTTVLLVGECCRQRHAE